MASDDEDVPESGAVFTFGKTRFADNLASKFWIRDDPVVQVACGDEHSAIITAKGKLYTFGSNDWGQLGHGNTKPYNKPSVVKKLKPEKSYLVACGRNHTLVATESGRLYSFGCGQDGQLGHDDSESCHDPKAIESLDSQRYSRLACGSDFSVAVTADGILYTWGSSGEGQNGLGEDAESPKRLYLAGKVISVACGYYHMAVVTDDGSLYTCGEKGGKLGLEESQLNDTSQLQKVEAIKEKVISVSCGSEFTVAVTQNGHVYSFGQGNQGQLGLGSALTECELPEKLQTFDRIKAKNVECGESFTAIVTKHGNLYTFGDGRHGKLGLGDECFSNLFKPQKVTRFNNFIVKKVSCGGCHMLVSAVKKEESVEESDSEEQVEKETLMATMKPRQFLDAVDGPSLLSSTWSARDKRRQKNVEDINNSLSHSLPPINKSSLPPLNGTLKRTLPALGKINLNEEEKKPVNPLNVSKLPQITHPDGEEDNQTTSKSQSSPKSSPRPLPRGHKPTPLAAPRALPRTKKEKEETESEEESGSEEESEEEKDDGKTKKQIKEGVKKTEDAEKEMKKGKQAEEEESEEEDEEEESETDEDESKKEDFKKTAGKDKTDKLTKEPTTTKDDEDEEEEEEDDEESEEQDEEDDDIKNKKKSKDKVENIKEKKSKKIEVGSSGKKGEKGSEDEEEEDEEEEEESEDDKDAKKKKTKKDSKEDEKEKKSKKGKKKCKDDKDKDEDKGDKEATEESTEKTKKTKKKGKKKEETKQEDDDDDEEGGDKDDDKNKDEDDKEKTDKDKKDEGKETPKNAAKQKDKKSGICVML